MTRPEVSKVGPYNYTIEWFGIDDWIADEEDGWHNYATLTIGIYEGLPPRRMAVVFLHEHLHAVCHCMGLEDGSKEEGYVTGIATYLVSIIKDNPMLVKWWISLLK